jgi:F0F1-type ATP synthase assembly protein I
MALVPVVSMLLGWALDRMLGTFPWLTMALLGLGFIAGGREVWMKVKR